MISHDNLARRRFLQASAALAAAPLVSAAPPGPRARRGGSPALRKPPLFLNIRDFGATGDGKAKDTGAIQQAIDRCSVLGGGEVFVPAGEYFTGAIALRSNTLLRLEKESSIIGSPDFADYPVSQVRWEGKWIPGRVALIYALDASRIGIVGPGKIVGNPAVGGRPNQQNPLRHPALIEPINCRDIRFEGFSTSHRLMWSIHPTNCESITIKDLTIRSTGGNGDGIDVDSCRHVRIEGCDIATGDDCISIKSGRGNEAYALLQTSEDILITNCTMADSIFACIGIGSETSGGIRNVRIEHCKFTGARTFAIYIKSRPGRGAFIEDISASDLDVSGMTGGFLCLNILNSGIQDQSPVPGDEGIPTIRNFRFSGVRVKDCEALVDGVRIHPNKPLDGFSLVNVTGTCRKGISLANVRKAEIRTVKVTGLMGPVVSIHNVFGQGSQRRRERRSTETARSSCGAEPAVSASLRLERWIAGVSWRSDHSLSVPWRSRSLCWHILPSDLVRSESRVRLRGRGFRARARGGNNQSSAERPQSIPVRADRRRQVDEPTPVAGH